MSTIDTPYGPIDKTLLMQLKQIKLLACDQYNPALIANYTYDLVKSYNTFYQNISVLGSTDATQKAFRIALSEKVAEVIANASSLLGIIVPSRM